MQAKHLNTRIQNEGARDNRLWEEFTRGAVSVVIKYHSISCACGCKKVLNIGDIACRVSANGGLSTKYLSPECYETWKSGLRNGRRVDFHAQRKSKEEKYSLF